MGIEDTIGVPTTPTRNTLARIIWDFKNGRVKEQRAADVVSKAVELFDNSFVYSYPDAKYIMGLAWSIAEKVGIDPRVGPTELDVQPLVVVLYAMYQSHAIQKLLNARK